jgi:hypothetical protein
MYMALYVAADLYASSEVADLLAATIRPSLRGRFQDNLQMARLLGALSGHNRILCDSDKACFVHDSAILLREDCARKFALRPIDDLLF